MKKAITILSFAICLYTNAQVCFNPVTNFATGIFHYSVTNADFNGDGYTDIAAANMNSNNVSVLFGTGTGSFGAVTNFSVGIKPLSITSADFNGDGIADLVTANETSNNITILLGTVTGSFGAATNFALGTGTNPSSVTSADFNGDGKADLAIANDSSNNIAILLGTGTGSFGVANYLAVGTNPRSITSADFNGDGKADLAIANMISGNVSILLGTGTGNFGVATNYTVGSWPRSVKVADFNNDGKADLAVVNCNTNNISILLGTGIGSFGAATNYTVGDQPFSVAIADFNGDSEADLAVANAYSNNVSILLGTGVGNFSTAINFATDTYPRSVISTDFNGDGKFDLAIATSNSVSVLINGLPTVSAGFDSVICSGTSVTLSGSGATSYAWDNGVTNGVPFTPLSTATYTVIGTTAFGCTNTDQVDIIVRNVFNNEQICLVTVDTVTWKNKVMWEKTLGVGSEYYLVYKETGTNSYSQIGNVATTQPSEFIDLFSVPESHGDKYKISVLDTCGNESDLSFYHKTMNLTIAAFGSTMGLNWDDYVDESGNYVPFRYYIYRGTSPNNMTLHDSVSGSFNSYNDINVFSVYYYIIGVKKTGGCNTTKSDFISFSNKKDNHEFIGINEVLYGTITVSPNPFSEFTTISIPNTQIICNNAEIIITDVTGKVVRIVKLTNNQTVIERGVLKAGVYFVKMRGYRLYRGKLIIE